MASPQDNVSMALFCDFENVALGVRDANYEQFDIKPILERLLLKGSIVIKKAYCDWDRYKGFKKPMHEANFELIEIPHVRQSGKNSADIRLVVDALDLCYTKSHVNTFVIISGDSDFSPLVSKLRENNKQVIGVGVKQSTSDLLVANCDEFIFYDDLVRENQRRAAKRNPGTREAQPANNRSPEEEKRRKDDVASRRSKAIELAVETFDALVLERGDGGKMWASVLKEAIKRRKPDFNESYYGFRAFGNLLEEAQARGLLEFGRDEKSGTYVYRGNGGLSDAEPSAERPAQDAESETSAPTSRRREPRQRGGRNSASRLRDAASSQAEAPRDAQAALPLASAEGRSGFAQDQDEDDAHVEAQQQPSYDSGVDTWMSVQDDSEDDVHGNAQGDVSNDVSAAPAAERQAGRSDEKRSGEKSGRGARNRGGRRGRENAEARQGGDQAWPVAQDESPVAPWDELPAVSAAGPQPDPFEPAPRARDAKADADARESQDESGQESGQGAAQGAGRTSTRESRDPARGRTRENGRNRGRGAKSSTATSADASPFDDAAAPAAPAASSAPEAPVVNTPAAPAAAKPFIGNAFLLPETAQAPSTKKAATVTRAPRRRRAADPAEASAENMATPAVAAEPSTVDVPVAAAPTKKPADKVADNASDRATDGEAATDAKPAARKTAARSRRPRKTTSTPDAG